MLTKHFWKIAALVAIIAIGGAYYYSQKQAEEANQGVKTEAHIKGSPDAKVTLIEYSDFQCPACGQFYPYVKEVMDEYGDQIRFEYRHFPLITVHPYAIPAAQAAEAAGVQGKFWEMHDQLFENQSVWSKAKNPSGLFKDYAEKIGLDMAMYERQVNSSILRDVIDDSFNDARGRGFNGTPTFLLNDKEMEFTTFEEFKGQIEAAVKASAN